MALVEDARPAARRLLAASSGGTVRIVAHPSADGVAATAILARALARAERSFHARFERPELADGDPDADPGDVHLFLGLGAPPGLGGPRLTGATFLVDATAAPWPRDAQGLVAFNPVQHGEPAAAASASTAALALALALGEANADLAPLGLCGAIASGRPPAHNAWAEAVRAEALRSGLLLEAPRLNFGDEALLDLLAFPPELLGALGSGYDRAEAFLRDHRLPGEATVHELDEAGRQRLASALTVRLLQRGQAAADLARLVAPHLLQPPADLSLARLGSWLDVAAREGEGGLALAYLLGDGDARANLETLEARVRSRRRASLRVLEAGPDLSRKGLAVGTVEDASDVAPLATLLSGRWSLGDRILVLSAPSGNDVRISLRAAGSPTADLGALAERAATEAGGHGGGRPDAAGARVPHARLEAFLAALGTQRGGAAG